MKLVISYLTVILYRKIKANISNGINSKNE